MDMVERVKGILLQPKQEWEVIAGETTSIVELYKSYIIILGAIGPIAAVIGMSIVGVNIPFAGSFRVPITTSIAAGVVQYILTLVGVYVLARVIDALAPTFSCEKNLNQAFKLAAYSYTPGWLAGIFVIIPTLGILGILGLYGLYLIYVGLPVLMKSPREKSMGYTVAVVIAGIVISVLIGAVSHAFISYPTSGMHMPGM
ncbi:MAG: YIP1 family protein [Deltaproteobacteria bacterium CG23_combo_of_CG06-09_8_20_14_all_60_8]|nr:MAG: YIP1 family protein [Deltaproteobacteria bacterium CG23_combo_of_CG06-09_8_20_14_all_60_8]